MTKTGLTTDGLITTYPKINKRGLWNVADDMLHGLLSEITPKK